MFDGRMSWGESWALAMELVGDPTSRVGASVASWAHPTSRDALILMDLYDLTLNIAAGRKSTRPYPRPSDPRPTRTQTALPQSVIRAALKARGHGNPD